MVELLSLPFVLFVGICKLLEMFFVELNIEILKELNKKEN